jgi:hypothetical protein
MPTVPQGQRVIDVKGRPTAPATADMRASMEATGRAVVETALPGSSDAAAARDSYLIGQQIGPALREGRYSDAIKAFLESTGAAIGVAPMLPSLAGVIRAFHGTPHQFDKFDLSKVGTGEGAQAFGHGLYFAERKGVAENYRDQLSRGVRLDNQPVPVDHPLFGELNILANNPNFDIAAEKARMAELAAYYEKAGGPDSKKFAEWYRRDNERWDEAEKLAPRLTRSGGNLYGVDLDVNHEDLLDWDAPLSLQPPKVREALKKAGVSDEDFPTIAPDDVFGDVPLAPPAGHEVYRRAMLKHGSPEAASKALREAGIPGIRYLDAGSRGGGEGSRNVVLFDDRLAKIVERNGQPVAVPKPATERAAEGMGALADPQAWVKP